MRIQAVTKKNSYGKLLWEYATTGSILSTPAIGLDGTIYIGTVGGALYAINTDGSSKWSYWEMGKSVWRSSPAIGKDGTIYIGDDDNYI